MLTKAHFEEESEEKKQKQTKHYHTLERLKSKTKRKDIYRCVHPDCNFYGPSHLLEGKHAICKLCGTQFTLTNKALQLKTPHCGCRNTSQMEQEILLSLGKTEDEQARVAIQRLEPLLPQRPISD